MRLDAKVCVLITSIKVSDYFRLPFRHLEVAATQKGQLQNLITFWQNR